MKQVKKFLLIMSLGVLSMATLADSITRDEAQIRSNIHSFAAMADQGAYEYLGRILAPELLVDYVSLFGGEPILVSNTQLMTQWAGFLPGFDTTYHELSNFQLTLDKETASANVDFTARHWLGDQGFWAVSGQYVFTFVRSPQGWLINSLKVLGTSEEGSREVLGQAPSLAQKNHQERQALLIKYQ